MHCWSANTESFIQEDFIVSWERGIIWIQWVTSFHRYSMNVWGSSRSTLSANPFYWFLYSQESILDNVCALLFFPGSNKTYSRSLGKSGGQRYKYVYRYNFEMRSDVRRWFVRRLPYRQDFNKAKTLPNLKFNLWNSFLNIYLFLHMFELLLFNSFPCKADRICTNPIVRHQLEGHWWLRRNHKG